MSNLITVHIVNDIPWSNLNRDDTGTPKRTILGGVERGLLSSQSIKRAIRKDFESRIMVDNGDDLLGSYRSRNLPELVASRAVNLVEATGASADFEKLQKCAGVLIKSLTGKADAKDTITWLSVEELETIASIVADDAQNAELEVLLKAKNPSEGFSRYMKKRGVTGSLAIAAFGRMFANATSFQTEAAIAVSPAISTHSSIIETDYFIAADDWASVNDTAGAGAAHLGVALYTSGVFYRSVTIDVQELLFNWSGKSGALATEQLTQLLKSIIYTLPTGKKNATAPYSEPLLLVAEQQDYRQAYSISAPVVADETGFQSPSVSALKRQFEVARKISGGNYGDHAVSGVRGHEFSEDVVSIDRVIETVLSWIPLEVDNTADHETL